MNTTTILENTRKMYYLILRDPVYFNEYTFSVYPTASAALNEAVMMGKHFFRIDIRMPESRALESK